MHRPIGTVFKFLGISILLMIIMDVSFIAIDTLTVNNRITTMSKVMQDELMRNNAIPNDIARLFDNQLNEIVENSNIAAEIEWNLNHSLTIDGETYPPINEANVVDYGELTTLAIRVKMQPHSLLFFRRTESNEGSFLGKSMFEYYETYAYPVPALRYLK